MLTARFARFVVSIRGVILFQTLEFWAALVGLEIQSHFGASPPNRPPPGNEAVAFASPCGENPTERDDQWKVLDQSLSVECYMALRGTASSAVCHYAKDP